MAHEGYKPKSKNNVITLRLSDEIDQFIADLSKESQCTKSNIIRSMIDHCKTLAARGALDIKGGA